MLENGEKLRVLDTGRTAALQGSGSRRFGSVRFGFVRRWVGSAGSRPVAAVRWFQLFPSFWFSFFLSVFLSFVSHFPPVRFGPREK